jgi:hypothetical protein
MLPLATIEDIDQSPGTWIKQLERTLAKAPHHRQKATLAEIYRVSQGRDGLIDHFARRIIPARLVYDLLDNRSRIPRGLGLCAEFDVPSTHLSTYRMTVDYFIERVKSAAGGWILAILNNEEGAVWEISLKQIDLDNEPKHFRIRMDIRKTSAIEA